MNPLTNMKNVIKLSEQELHTSNKTSWHDQYRDSAWVFIGGLPYDLTEGDIICIFSQYGEIVNINLIRDKDTGKSKGFCFLCYEDQRSTDLAVDNFNGIKILGRIIRVDHVSNYKVPKQGKKTDEETKKLYDEGCAPKLVAIQTIVKQVKVKTERDDFRETLADQIMPDIKLPERLPIYNVKQEKVDSDEAEKNSSKKHKEKKKKKHKKRKSETESSSDESDSDKKKKKKKKKHKKMTKHLSKSDSDSDDSDDSSKRKSQIKKGSSSNRSKSCERYEKLQEYRRRSRSPNNRTQRY